MRYYEAIVISEKCICVKAQSEEEAIEVALQAFGRDCNRAKVDIEDDWGNGTEPSQTRWIEQYKRNGEYVEAAETPSLVPPVSTQ